MTSSTADSSAAVAEERLDAPPVPWMHGAAGILGGSISMTLFYPLDLLRTRLHTTTGPALTSARQVLRSEGIRGMYRGVGVAVGAHSLGWGLYLTLFRYWQGRIATARGGPSSVGDLTAACIAATVTSTVVTPLNVVKTRAQLESLTEGAAVAAGKPLVAEASAAAAASAASATTTTATAASSTNAAAGAAVAKKRSRGIASTLVHIAQTEGPRALLRGVGPQILLSFHTAIQVALYELVKRRFWPDGDAPMLGVAVASASSKAVAATICNPLEVLRTRLQDKRNRGSPAYSSIWTAFRTIVANEGVGGLYRGVGVNVCRVVPTTVIAFVLYERCLIAIKWASGAVRPRKAPAPPQLAARSTAAAPAAA